MDSAKFTNRNQRKNDDSTKMSDIDKILDSAKLYYKYKNVKHGRYRSWEHCYKHFKEAREKKDRNNPDVIDYLSLHLAFYLASWGMYRGSSFLLRRDYKIHEQAVKEILKKEYDVLLGIKCCELEKNLDLLNKLYRELEKYYCSVRNGIQGKKVRDSVSSTLLTKILMGTLGCVPAYDRFFISGVKNQGVTTGNYNDQSLRKLAKFYEDNHVILEQVRKGMMIENCIEYPQMKLLDMAFWQVGKDLEDE